MMERLVFTQGSGVHRRYAQRGNAHPEDQLEVIVFSTRAHHTPAVMQVAPNVRAYATNSRSRLWYGYDAIRIARRLRRPDVVSAQDPFEAGLAAWIIAGLKRVPLLLELHTDPFSSGYAEHMRLNQIRVGIMNFVLPRAQRGYVVSERVRDLLLKKFTRAPFTTVLPIYIDVARFNAVVHVPHPRFTISLLWIGRLEPEKRLEVALASVAQARAAGYDVGLTVVGTGRLLSQYQQLVIDLGIEKWVEFVGQQHDIRPYLAHADTLLVTSVYEGYGMVTIEALAAHVPVLSTDVGIAREAGATIVDGDFGKALIGRLAHPHRAVLHAYPYPDEQAYFDRLRELHASIVPEKRLLVITQSMDTEDPVLGFFHTWVRDLAPHYDSVNVICLRKGRYELPENVRVHSLGKERGVRPTFIYVLRFYRLLWRLRGSYDSVFVHMNEEYVLLAGILWRITGKRISFWRNFHTGSWRTWLAVLLANRVFCTSRASYTAQFSKTCIMPVGVELDAYKGTSETQRPLRMPRSIVSLGRISPVKRLDVLVDALVLLACEEERTASAAPFTAAVYGDPLPHDISYHEQLQKKVRDAHAESFITFHPGIPHAETPQVFQKFQLFVNLSHSGMYDKTIFEAAAAGALPVASSADYASEAPVELAVTSLAPKHLATQLRMLIDLSSEEQARLRRAVFALAESHALPKLITALVREL
jgi:glycosyltransferase involved in cell wall biosynthesis